MTTRTPSQASLERQQLALPAGRLDYREHGAGPTIVLLHGISSGSSSWVPVVPYLSHYRLLAWDAPGYADSQPLAEPRPRACDYAERLDDWLSALVLSAA